MERWKTRPNLELTLMRTINCQADNETRSYLLTKYKLERYNFWKTTNIARNSAASAIQEIFITKKNNLENAYKRLHFSKLNFIDYDLSIKILKSI